MSSDLFVFAGEKSGDLHGEKLLESLKKLAPHLTITGVGGPKMRAQGMECVLPMEEFQVMGFIDVFLTLPKLIRHFYFIAKTILKTNPKTVLFIDYPGFNLRMARHLRKKGYQGKICHFICPSVWAWGKARIPLMAQHLDLLLTILPFENNYFAHTPLRVEFVGHPLIQRLKDHSYTPFPLPLDRPVIAIFPGSRKKELLRNFPQYLNVCRTLQKTHPHLFFAISLSDEKYQPLLEKMIHQAGFHAQENYALIPMSHTYDLMKRAHCAIAKSGTITLELALHQVPTVVTYAISALDLIIATKIVKIQLPFYSLVNIIGNQEIFPELFGPHFTEDALLTAIVPFLSDPHRRQRCQQACQELAASLTQKDASLESAKALLPFIK